ncbi:MAG: hypothetical protein WAQ98_31490 [Blastocatellia bacterium]
MKFFSKPKLIVLVLLVGLLATGFIYYKYITLITKKDMAEYVPDSAAAFLEVNSLSNLFAELIKTKAWQDFASKFGISNQVEYIADAANIVSFTGLGLNEATLLARAQYVVVLDGLKVETKSVDESDKDKSKESEGSNELEVIPQLALVIETHSNKVEQYLSNRVNLLAKRIYGDNITSREETFQDIKIKIFQVPNTERQIVTAQKGSVMIIGNSKTTIESCLAVLLGQKASFKQDPYLKLAREKLSKDSAIFGFVTGKTVASILQISTNILPESLMKNNESEQGLPSIISAQLIDGIAYSVSFDNKQVVEKYFTLVKPDLALKISSIVKPIANQDLTLTNKLMTKSLDFTVFFLEEPAQIIEELITAISAHTNVVVSFALRQLVINLGKQYGIEPNEPIGNLISNENALMKLTNNDKFLFLLKVKDKLKLLPTMGRYLRKGSTEKVNSEEYKSLEIVTSPDKEMRAIVFLEEYLLIGTRLQLMEFIDIWQQDQKIQTNNLELVKNNPTAIFLSYKLENQKVGEFFLNVSRLLRTTDGAREILSTEPIKSLLTQTPASISIGYFSDEGLMIEKRSSLGVFTWLSNLIGPTEELKESETFK